MRSTWSSLFISAIGGLFVLAGSAGALSGQEPTQITGTVTDQAGRPLVSANVLIDGIPVATTTNQQGRFLLIVPASFGTGQEVTVRAELIGRAPQEQMVTLEPGATLTLEFVLNQDPLQLRELVATATGQEVLMREIGSDVDVLNVAEINLAPVSNLSDLLQARSPGVTVIQSSGTAGAGSRIRIRGSNSMSLSNSPLLIIDGIRVNNETSSYELFTGGQQTSRLNDLNPEEIESIEIIKGPSAASLYGTAAANGVIQIRTRSGGIGPASWRFWAEAGVEQDNIDFPSNVWAVDAGGVRCDLLRLASGACAEQEETYTFNPLENEESTPFRRGWSQSYGANVSGGTPATSYFLSGEWSEATGTQLENRSDRTNLRANVTGQLRDNLSVRVGVGYTDSDTRLPQNDNSALGVLKNGLLGVPLPAIVEGAQGYRLPLEMLLAWDNFQAVTRTTMSGSADWQPLEWLSLNATGGVDDLSREDRSGVPPGVLPFGPPFSVGFMEVIKFGALNWTASSNATAEWDYSEEVSTSTSLGVQYFRERTNLIYATGTDIAPDVGSLAGVTAGFSVAEENFENITFGAYLAESVGWRDRLFLNFAVRGDQNAAFGQNLDWIWYPSVSASWLINEEEFFPQVEIVDQLRIRGAFGRSGLRPDFRDAKQFFESVTAANVGGEAPGLVFGGIGNPDLKPELATEYELGVEAGFLEGRVGVEITYYNKKSEDALVERTLAPSLGVTEVRIENIGSMTNSGWEFSVGGDVVRTPMVNWSVDFAAATNDNEVSSLGGVPPIVFGLLGNTQEHREGFAAGSYFQRPIESFEDTNGDGLIGLNEVQVGSETQYIGKPFPDLELSFSTGVRLWNRVTVSGLLDFKGGHHLFNATTWGRCSGVASPVCEARFDLDTPLSVQAAIAAYDAAGTVAGFIEEADFWKLREVSVAVDAPQQWAQAIGGQSMRLTVAGRNLFTWTGYSGFDPEVNGSGQDNFTTNDDTTLPAFRSFFVRMDISF